jgi:hypothetical protein
MATLYNHKCSARPPEKTWQARIYVTYITYRPIVIFITNCIIDHKLWFISFSYFISNSSDGFNYQIEKYYFAQEVYFPWEKCAEISDIFTEIFWQTKLGPAVRNCCQIGRSEICLVLGSQRHFVQILQNYLKNFAKSISSANRLGFRLVNTHVWKTL